MTERFIIYKDGEAVARTNDRNRVRTGETIVDVHDLPDDDPIKQGYLQVPSHRSAYNKSIAERDMNRSRMQQQRENPRTISNMTSANKVGGRLFNLIGQGFAYNLYNTPVDSDFSTVATNAAADVASGVGIPIAPVTRVSGKILNKVPKFGTKIATLIASKADKYPRLANVMGLTAEGATVGAIQEAAHSKRTGDKFSLNSAALAGGMTGPFGFINSFAPTKKRQFALDLYKHLDEPNVSGKLLGDTRMGQKEFVDFVVNNDFANVAELLRLEDRQDAFRLINDKFMKEHRNLVREISQKMKVPDRQAERLAANLSNDDMTKLLNDWVEANPSTPFPGFNNLPVSFAARSLGKEHFVNLTAGVLDNSVSGEAHRALTKKRASQEQLFDAVTNPDAQQHADELFNSQGLTPEQRRNVSSSRVDMNKRFEGEPRSARQQGDIGVINRTATNEANQYYKDILNGKIPLPEGYSMQDVRNLLETNIAELQSNRMSNALLTGQVYGKTKKPSVPMVFGTPANQDRDLMKYPFIEDVEQLGAWHRNVGSVLPMAPTQFQMRLKDLNRGDIPIVGPYLPQEKED